MFSHYSLKTLQIAIISSLISKYLGIFPLVLMQRPKCLQTHIYTRTCHGYVSIENWSFVILTILPIAFTTRQSWIDGTMTFQTIRYHPLVWQVIVNLPLEEQKKNIRKGGRIAGMLCVLCAVFCRVACVLFDWHRIRSPYWLWHMPRCFFSTVRFMQSFKSISMPLLSAVVCFLSFTHLFIHSFIRFWRARPPRFHSMYRTLIRILQSAHQNRNCQNGCKINWLPEYCITCFTMLYNIVQNFCTPVISVNYKWNANWWKSNLSVYWLH